VRLIRKFALPINGLELSVHSVGQILSLPEHQATMLIAEGWAECQNHPPIPARPLTTIEGDLRFSPRLRAQCRRLYSKPGWARASIAGRQSTVLGRDRRSPTPPTTRLRSQSRTATASTIKRAARPTRDESVTSAELELSTFGHNPDNAAIAEVVVFRLWQSRAIQSVLFHMNGTIERVSYLSCSWCGS
jgi:hypothetical protein